MENLNETASHQTTSVAPLRVVNTEPQPLSQTEQWHKKVTDEWHAFSLKVDHLRRSQDSKAAFDAGRAEESPCGERLTPAEKAEIESAASYFACLAHEVWEQTGRIEELPGFDCCLSPQNQERLLNLLKHRPYFSADSILCWREAEETLTSIDPSRSLEEWLDELEQNESTLDFQNFARGFGLSDYERGRLLGLLETRLEKQREATGLSLAELRKIYKD